MREICQTQPKHSWNLSKRVTIYTQDIIFLRNWFSFYPFLLPKHSHSLLFFAMHSIRAFTYQSSYLFPPWPGRQAPIEMQGWCHWPTCHGVLGSLLSQSTNRQTGRVKPGLLLIWTKAIWVYVTWTPAGNGLWMTNILLRIY